MDTRWKELQYNPLEKNLKKEYPDLFEYDEFKEQPIEKVRMAIMLSTAASPIYKDYKDHEIRVKKSCELSGVEYTEKIQYDKDINRMVHRLFSMENNIYFKLWYTQLLAYDDVSYQLTLPIDSKNMVSDTKTKAEISTKLIDMANNLAKTEVKLFQDPQLKSLVSRAVAGRKRQFAERLAVEDAK
jgi:hypothetical protein